MLVPSNVKSKHEANMGHLDTFDKLFSTLKLVDPEIYSRM